MRHENIITQNIWRASYNGIWAMNWTVIGTSHKSNRAVVGPDSGAAINNTSTVTAGISNSRNRLSRHGQTSSFICYTIKKIFTNTYHTEIIYFFTKNKSSSAVIFVGDTAVKASSVDKNFSLSRLSKRLGEFKPGYYSERTFNKPAPEPVSHVAGRNGWTTGRRSKEWLKKDASPERSRRNAGKLWNSDSKSAERRLQHVLPSMGYRC